MFKFSNINGIYGIYMILCPLAITNEGIAEAAIAEATAFLFWVTFIHLCHFLQVCNGANILPFLHMFPKAPWLHLLVPDPLTLGILATALPGCQDSALCCIPAYWFTPFACILFLSILLWTNFTTSNLIGADITSGILTFVLTSNSFYSFELNTEMVGLDII